jgi:cytochrome c-type biogenesis protein CcmH
MKQLLITFLLLVAPIAANAVQPDEILADTRLETRARVISAELRCLVCQNQSIDDSDADLARELRLLVRERLQSGDSDEQVLAAITARYGNFVLLEPPVNRSTIALWLLPFLVLGAGAATAFIKLRPAPPVETVDLAEEDRKLVTEYLDRT